MFGPTLVRASDSDMMAMVTDMGHQCRIIESVLAAGHWFFEEAEDEDDELLEDELEAAEDMAAAAPASVMGRDASVASIPALPASIVGGGGGGGPGSGRSVSLTQVKKIIVPLFSLKNECSLCVFFSCCCCYWYRFFTQSVFLRFPQSQWTKYTPHCIFLGFFVHVLK